MTGCIGLGRRLSFLSFLIVALLLIATCGDATFDPDATPSSTGKGSTRRQEYCPLPVASLCEIGGYWPPASTPTPNGSVTPTATPTSTPTPTPGGSTITLSGTVYSINSHPRIFLDTAKRAALRTRSVAGVAMWDALVSYNNGNAPSCATEYDIIELTSFTIGYAGDPTRTAWRDCAIRELMNLVSSWSNNADYASEDLIWISQAYDYLYNDLSPAQRTSVRDWVYGTVIPLIQTHVYYFRKAGNTEYTHNLYVSSFAGEFIWALASAGDDARSNNMLATDWDYYVNNFKPVYDAALVGCRPFGGSHYGEIRTLQRFFLSFAAAETALGGMAMWPAWGASCSDYHLHHLLPTLDGFMPDFQPGAINYMSGRDRLNAAILVQKFGANDSAKQLQYFLANDYVPTKSGTARGFISNYYVAQWQLFWSPAATAIPYNTQPLAYTATGTAVGISRSAWNNPAATYVDFSAAAYWGDHESIRCGSYRAFRNGEWLIIENDNRYTAGNSGQTYADGMYQQAILFGDGNITNQWGQTFYTGGFKRFGYDNWLCGIGNSSNSPTYAYWMADLSDAVDARTYPVTYYFRHLIHFKGAGTNYLVATSAVNTTGSVAKREMMYVPSTVTGTSPNANFSLTNSAAAVRRIYPTTVGLTKTVVPDRTAASDVPQNSIDTPTRLDIAAPAGNSELFMVVWALGAKGSTTMPTTTALTSTVPAGQLKGVLINDATQSRVFLVTKDDQTIGSTVAFTAAATNLPAEFVIAGLTAGTKYNLTKSSNTYTLTVNAAGTKVVDGSSVLRFTN
ncbi:MAG: hypothetical protein V1495_01585 [Pseudomonadota bacterium]